MGSQSYTEVDVFQVNLVQHICRTSHVDDNSRSSYQLGYHQVRQKEVPEVACRELKLNTILGYLIRSRGHYGRIIEQNVDHVDSLVDFCCGSPDRSVVGKVAVHIADLDFGAVGLNGLDNWQDLAAVTTEQEDVCRPGFGYRYRDLRPNSSLAGACDDDFAKTSDGQAL